MLYKLLAENTRLRWLQKIYRWGRIAYGWNNGVIVRARMHRVRPNISAAFDTMVAQLCKVERGAWYTTGKQDIGDQEINSGFYGPLEVQHTKEHQAEIPYINAICEMARRSELDLFAVPTIEEEKRKRPERHSDNLGCVNIDHDVRYRNLGFKCPRIKHSLTTLRGFPSQPDSDCCSIATGPYSQLLKHFQGKGQFKDAWHLVLCDALGVEIFFTCDGKFLRRYKQVEEKMRSHGLRTKAMRPSEFCKRLKISGVPIARTDPFGLFRGTVR